MPYKNDYHFRRYFDTCKQIKVKKDVEILFLFKVYFLSQIYFGLVYSFLYLFPLSSATRIVLIDSSYILGENKSIHILTVIFLCLTLNLTWAIDFKNDSKFNLIFENILFGDSEVIGHENRFVCSEDSFTRKKFCQFVNLTSILMQAFSLFMIDFCISIFIFIFFFTLCGSSGHFLFESAFNFILLMPILLFNLFCFIAFWTSFFNNIVFYGTYLIVSLIYLLTVFRQNNAKLAKAIKKRSLCLCAALQRNLNLFEFLFIADAYFGQLFLNYLVVFMPVSAFCISQIILGKILRRVTRYLMLAHSVATFLGIFCIQNGIGRLSGVSHRGGKILLLSIAQNSLTKKRLPLKQKLNLCAHIQRLYVKKKYGITFGSNLSYFLTLLQLKTMLF